MINAFEANAPLDLLDRHLHRFRLVERGGNVDRPPLRTDVPGTKPRQIGVHGIAIPGFRVFGMFEIEIADLVGEAAAQLDRHIVVPIPHRGGFQRGPRGFFGGLRSERAAHQRCNGANGGETA